MPRYRLKLLPGSKVIHKQKEWGVPFLSRLPMFRWLKWSRLYCDMRTPINKMKEKAVDMERKLTMLKAAIKQAEKEYEQQVKHMSTKVKMHDKDGGALTQWKEEPLPWHTFSVFDWAKDYTDEPPAYDPKTYGVGGSGRPQRTKEMEAMVTSFGEDVEKARQAYKEDVKGGVKDTNLFSFTPGKEEVPQHEKNRRKNETDEQYKERLKKLEGELKKI